MRKRWLRSGLLALWTGVAVFGAAGVAGAGTLWRWKTDDGAIAYADDEKRVPERYRERAEQVTPEALEGLGRITETDAEASQQHADRLGERLAALRAAAAQEQAGEAVGSDAPAAARAPARHPVSELALRSMRETDGRRRVVGPDGRTRWVRTTRMQAVDDPVPSVAFDADPDDPRPIVVENVRVRAGDSITTEHVTVVRQGDRVLSVIRPRDAQSSFDWPRLEDLTE
jgi:hypothetical protein